MHGVINQELGAIMAVFNKNTLTQISGFDNPIIAGELVYQQQTYWNIGLTAEDGVTPVDLTGATIDAQIVRRTLSNVQDTRYGLSFDIGNYSPTPEPIPLSITNRVDLTGSFTLVIDDSTWDLINTDPELEIDYVNGVVTLNQFNPLTVDNTFGELTLTVNPSSTIISSTYNRIITVDPYDPNAIIVNITAKK